MTLLFCDSAAHLSQAQGARKYQTYGATSIVTGRFGAGSSAYTVGTFSEVTRTIPSTAEVIAGCSLKLPTLSAFGRVLSLRDTGTNQVYVQILVDGRIAVYRGDGTQLAVSTVAILSATWYHLGLRVKIDPAVGTVKVTLNGATVINAAGLNTRNTAVSAATQVVFGSDINQTPAFQVGDIYIADTAGVRNNDLLGDVRVQAVFPTGVGAYAEFGTLVGAAAQWDAVDDNPPDDDASYIGSAVAAQRSTFATGDVTPTSGTIAAAVVNHTSRKDDAGVRTVAGMCRSAAVDAAGVGVNVGDSYAIHQEIFETDPGGVAWTIASINGAEFGVKEIA